MICSRLANTSCRVLMDLGREAGVEVKIMTPFCTASVVSHLWDVFAVSNCTPASSPACHFISNRYGLGAGKSPELGTATTHWFPIPPGQFWESSSPSPEPSFRKGKTSSGGCYNRSLQGEQLLWAERQSRTTKWWPEVSCASASGFSPSVALLWCPTTSWRSFIPSICQLLTCLSSQLEGKSSPGKGAFSQTNPHCQGTWQDQLLPAGGTPLLWSLGHTLSRFLPHSVLSSPCCLCCWLAGVQIRSVFLKLEEMTSSKRVAQKLVQILNRQKCYPLSGFSRGHTKTDKPKCRQIMHGVSPFLWSTGNAAQLLCVKSWRNESKITKNRFLQLLLILQWVRHANQAVRDIHGQVESWYLDLYVLGTTCIIKFVQIHFWNYTNLTYRAGSNCCSKLHHK